MEPQYDDGHLLHCPLHLRCNRVLCFCFLAAALGNGTMTDPDNTTQGKLARGTVFVFWCSIGAALILGLANTFQNWIDGRW